MKYKSAKRKLTVSPVFAKSFTTSLNNLLRVALFKCPPVPRVKKVRHPSRKDPRSNKSLRDRERVKNFRATRQKQKAAKAEVRKRKEALHKLAKNT